MTAAALRYRALLETLDTWTAEARARHPGLIPCRTGCNACCHGPFDISLSDVLLLRETASRLPEPQRAALVTRALAAAMRQQELAPAWTAPHDIRDLGELPFDALCEALEDDACPCLEAGSCVVYEGRPAVCRMMGLGIESPGGATLPNACPIQGQFPEYAALPPQSFDLPVFEAEAMACQDEAGRWLLGTPGAEGYETTIAFALAGHLTRTVEGS